jgi:hypothetical protein
VKYQHAMLRMGPLGAAFAKGVTDVMQTSVTSELAIPELDIYRLYWISPMSDHVWRLKKTNFIRRISNFNRNTSPENQSIVTEDVWLTIHRLDLASHRCLCRRSLQEDFSWHTRT